MSPLAVPDLEHLPELVNLSQYEAVRLFIERAQAVKPDFQVTSANAPAVAAICAQLDGLPLAIELAAARIKLLPPQALLKRLEHRLEMLKGGMHNLPARHQTLRNAIQWSYDLLRSEERRLFRWLSVFVGGCTVEAAEAVYNAGTEQAMDVLEGITSLLDKSLLQQTVQGGEEPRLLMLETIREYGLECLVANEELEVAQRAHAAYYLALAEEAEPHLMRVAGIRRRPRNRRNLSEEARPHLVGAEQVVWLERLKPEFENLRAALQWSAAHRNDDMNLILRLSSGLLAFWIWAEAPE
jgi:predicted ATPase